MKASPLFRFVSLAGLVVLTLPLRAQPQGTWSGQVVDIRTGQPVEGFTLLAGVNGRVDPFEGYFATSGADGRFAITWPQDAWENWQVTFPDGHFLRTRYEMGDFPETDYYGHTYYDDDYLRIDFVRQTPEQNLLIRAIPRSAWIAGRALSAETGKPLVGVTVDVLNVGRHVASTTTDANGRFVFEKPFRAFDFDQGAWQPSLVYDVLPAGFRPDLEPRELPAAANNLAILVGDSTRFLDITPPVVDGKWSKPLPLLSSRTPAIRTFCTLLVPKADGKMPKNPVIAEILSGNVSPASLTQKVSFSINKKLKFKKGQMIRLKAASSSGLKVSFLSSKPKVLQIKGNKAIMRKKGKVVISAVQKGNGDWSKSKTVRRKVTIR